MLKVGVMQIDLHLPAAHSLKEKRGPLKRLLNQLRKQFSCSCCESGYQDLHQRARLGVALACSEAVTLQNMTTQISNSLRSDPDFILLDIRIETMNYDGD